MKYDKIKKEYFEHKFIELQKNQRGGIKAPLFLVYIIIKIVFIGGVKSEVRR